MNAQTDTPTPSALSWEGDRAPLAKAFVAAQKAMEGIKKAASNPAFKSRYADLAHVVEGVTPALNAAGVGVMQFPSYDGDLVGVTTTLLHESGASVTATLHLRPTKNDPQGCGSAITYARRYALLAITGCAPEDDDGNAASAKPVQPAAKVSTDQLAQIEDLIERSGAAPSAVLQAYGITKFADLPASAFGKLTAQLNARIAKAVQPEAA